MKKLTLIFIFYVLSIALFAGNAKVDKATEAKVKAVANKHSLEFIENKGQFINSDGKVANNVLFKASYGNCDIYITDKGISYVFYKIDDSITSRTYGNELRITEGLDTNRKVFYYRLDMDLVGASILKENIVKEQESKQGHYNYFYPHCPDGIYDVKAYGKITIKNIYKGIDWVIYTNKNNKEQPIKYDFVVHPEANYKDIKLKYINADSVTFLDNNTKLKIQTIAGNIEEGNIYSYQNNKEEVKSKYTFNNDSTISFTINDYDKTKDLVIDPLVWATYYGGSNVDGFNAICTDSKDNIYITGYTYSYNFPSQQMTGAYFQSSLAGANNLILIKFNSQGVRLWATYYAGNGTDYGNSIITNSRDDLFITGFTTSTNLPTQQKIGAYWQPSNGGNNDIIILMFDSTGVRQWATYYGGTGDDQGNSICIDHSDNIYITGYTASSNFSVQQLSGAFWQASYSGLTDLVILKFDNQCVRQWATYYGGTGTEFGYSICSDNQNNIYITGATSSTNFPTLQLIGAYFQLTNAGNYDVFILKFDNTGFRQWATLYGGNNYDNGYSICSDSQNNIYIVGGTGSQSFPTQQLSGAYWQPNLSGGYNNDMFILKFNNQGARQWATYYGGSLYEDFTYFHQLNLLRIDGLDNIYITGSTSSSNFPIQQKVGEYWQANLKGIVDAILIKFNKYGVRQWATFYGDSTYSYGKGVAVDKQNNVYFVGNWLNTNAFTVNPGNNAYYDNTWNGQDDGYILKFNYPCNNKKTDSLKTNRNNICIYDSCNITLTAIGGSGDTLKWYTGACGQNYIGSNTPLTIARPAQTTTYYARWESICKISECDSIKINIDSVIRDTVYKNICTGQSYQVGIHTYTSSGIYTDSLVTNSGCDSIIKTYLTVNPYPIVNLGPDTALCYWQTYTLDATCPGATYMWQNGSVSSTFNINSIPGTYWVKVTYAGVCSTSDTVNVDFGPSAKVLKDTILCPGQSVLVNATTPGGTYLWENGSTNPIRTISAGGYYWVKTTINSYCFRTDTVHITISPVPVVNLGHDTILCYWQYIVLSAVNPNCQYLWQDGSTFSNKLINQTGTYWAKAIVNSGCWASDTVNISFKPSPSVNLGNDTVLCYGNSLNLNAYFPNCYYLWQNGSTNSTFNVTQAGTYKVIVSINNSCFNEDSINVTYVSPPTVNLGNDTNLCTGQTLTLKATYPGATYLWQNGSTNATFNVTQAGTYWVRVSINSGCYVSDTIHISYNSMVNLGNDTILCYGQTLTLNASYPNATYLWQDGSTNATYTVTPPYTPYVFYVKTTVNNCSGYDTIIISYIPEPTINFGRDTVLCNGDSILLDVTNPNATYVWHDNSTNSTYNANHIGEYSVSISMDGCIFKDTINITYTSNPSINLGNDTSLCPGQTITLNASFPNASYLWQNNSTNAKYVVIQQGTYWVVVSASNNCYATDTINVIYNQNPVVSLGNITILCPGQTLVLDATIINGIYQWQDGSTAPTFTATRDGVYEVIVIDTVTHCKNKSSITLDCDLEIVIPNIITPNGDGYNDFFVLTNSEYWIIELQIYDRWGTKIYEDGNYQNKWNGTNNGNPLSEGTYYYNIKAKNKKSGKNNNYHGSLTILR